MGLALRRSQFHLDVVRIAEGKHIDSKPVQVFDFAVRNVALIEEFDCAFKLGMIRHVETDMVQPDAVLVESVVGNGAGRVGGRVLQDVPVKLKVFDSMFVPLAKWSMLLTGNYRCITPQEPQSIRDAVHSDINLSQSIYDHVDAIAQRLGADPTDQVPFEKYAKAAESLLKPSSAARAVAGGAPSIERVDLLVKLISHQLGAPNAELDRTVPIVNKKLNKSITADTSGALRGAPIAVT
jgi:hypothetical protein